MTVDIGISPKPVDALTEVEFVPDLDELIASAKCSCKAGDDVPY